MGQDPKPTPLSRRAAAHATAAHSSAVHGGDLEPASAPQEALAGTVARALLPFLVRDDGWLRIVPQDDGATVYFKWKWTAGKHRDHYVMTVYPYFESAEALARLSAKMHAVDRGEQAPVKDHYFKG